MASFQEAQELLSKAEGGYQNDSRDSGNYTGRQVGVGSQIGTNYGISAPVLKSYLGYEPSVSDMKNLKYKTAVKIYRSQYWDVIKGDEIKNQKVANMVYDGAINMGVPRIKGFVNDSLGTIKYDITKVNAANPKKLFNDVGSRREKWYKARGGYALPSLLGRLEKLGYTGLEKIKKNAGITVAVVFGIGILITGIIYLQKK